MGLFAPRSEAELVAAAVGGLLEEGHNLDIKKELPAGVSANKELARDLASFAVDGGSLIIGVDEATTPPTLVPVPLDGLPERIEQVALARVDSPLPVRTVVVRTDNDPTQGYVIVHVSPSPMAPHMVDSRYWGRNDKTKYALADPEVTRLIELRRRWERSTADVLRQTVAADPTPLQLREQSHIFLVGLPIPANGEMALQLLHVPDWQRVLLERSQAWLGLSRVHPDSPGGFAPHLGQATQPERRPAGWALSSYRFEPGRVVPPDAHEESLVELEVDEDGALRAFCGRGSDVRGRNQGDEARVFFEALAAGISHQFLAVARGLSIDAGHFGSWDLGVAISNMAGTVSWEASEHYSSNPAVYGAEGYESTTRASVAELEQRPEAVAERLVGRLCRAFRASERPRIKPLLTPREIIDDSAG